MNFFTPWAFALSALLPIIIALYFLKLRREEHTVSSTYLWREMVRDLAANAPWQKLRPSWLLLLQLLFLIALMVTLTRPFTWTHTTSGDHLILILDSSASMAATDVGQNRLHEASDQARRLAASLPAAVPVTLIAAGDNVQVLLSASPDRSRLNQELNKLAPGITDSDMTTALELASAIAAGDTDAQIVVLSDGGVNLPEHLNLPSEIRYIPIGTSDNNQAISALSLDASSAGQGRVGFVRVNNYSSEAVERRLTLYADGQLVGARDLTLPATEAVAFTFPDLPGDTASLEARLEDEDALPLDDRAWAVAPLANGTQIQIVTSGNRFLETALTLMPNVEVTTISLADYEATWAEGATDDMAVETEDNPAPNWLTIFDGGLPQEGHYPPGALLFIGPVHSTEFFSVTGALEAPTPQPAGSNEPLLRYVDLRDMVVQESAELSLPAWGWPVITAQSDAETSSAPLLITGETQGHRVAVLAFDLRKSDLPLRVAFPLLLANLLDFLTPGNAGALPKTVQPGHPVPLPAAAQAESLIITRPDGSTQRLATGGEELIFDTATTPGVYTVDWEAQGEQWPLGRFAVNVFNPNESKIAPQPNLGVNSGAGQAIAQEHPTRHEWWRPVAWIALLVMLLEWLLQYRGALAWLGGKVRSAQHGA